MLENSPLMPPIAAPEAVTINGSFTRVFDALCEAVHR
jgi:hypothetical protein